MSRIFTVIRLPDGQDAGLGEDGVVSVEQAISAYRQWATLKMIEAIEILDAADDDFRIVVERGVHAGHHVRTLQEGRAQTDGMVKHG